MHLCLIDWGVHLPSIYIYMHCPRSSSGCSGMQGICAQLTGKATWSVMVFKAPMLNWLAGSICLLYICIVLDLVVAVVVCKTSVLNWPRRATWSVKVFKASMLNWLGVHLPSIYMHSPRSSSGCSGMQGICAWLTGEDLHLIALCYGKISVCQTYLVYW